MRNTLLTIFFITVFYSPFVYAKDLYFAGFSFLGNADQDFRYPVAVNLFDTNNTVFKNPLDTALKKLNRNDINLIYDLGKISSGEALAISFALTDEVIERFSTKDGVTNAYKIFAQILVFDFNEKKVITNFPVLVQNETITSGIPSSDYDFEIFQQMYLDTNFAGSIFNQWVKKLQDVKILNSSTLHLQLRNVELDTAVLSQIPDSLKNKNLLKVRSAQKLEYHISSKQNVPILPFTIGQIGNFKKGLIARFSDGIEYDLTLPDADFVVDMLIREFKNANVDKEKFVVKIFGAFITLKVSEPLSGKTYLDSKFNFKNELVIPKSENFKILNIWDVYQRTQDALFSKLSKQISLKDDKLKEITKTKNIKKQLTDFEEVIKKCK